MIEQVAAPPQHDGHRVRVWIDDDEHRVLRIEIYDHLGQPEYTVRYLGYERKGDEWRPGAIYVLDRGTSNARVVRELDEIAGIRLGDVRSAAIGCARQN